MVPQAWSKSVVVAFIRKLSHSGRVIIDVADTSNSSFMSGMSQRLRSALLLGFATKVCDNEGATVLPTRVALAGLKQSADFRQRPASSHPAGSTDVPTRYGDLGHEDLGLGREVVGPCLEVICRLRGDY
jgi:hypothetical protein